jgi:hypothetical protein
MRREHENLSRIRDLETQLQQAQGNRNYRTGRLRTRPLSTYNGDRRNEMCDRWTLEAQTWVHNQEAFEMGRSMTEDEKIAAVGSYTTERAQSVWLYWARLRTQGNPDVPTTLYGFLLVLRKHFSPPDAAVRRRRRFETARQTGTAQEFIFRLMDIRPLLEPIPSDEEMIRRIFNGLKDNIRYRVNAFPSVPTHLVDYQAFVIRVDESEYHQHIRHQNHGSLNAIAADDGPYDPATSDGEDNDGQDPDGEFAGYAEDYDDGTLNAVHTTRRHFGFRGRGGRGNRGRGGRQGRGSATQPSNRAANGNWGHRADIDCYRCKQLGHIARNCTAEKVAGQ